MTVPEENGTNEECLSASRSKVTFQPQVDAKGRKQSIEGLCEQEL